MLADEKFRRSFRDLSRAFVRQKKLVQTFVNFQNFGKTNSVILSLSNFRNSKIGACLIFPQ